MPNQEEERAKIMATSYKVMDQLTRLTNMMEKAGFSKAPSKSGKIACPVSPTKKQKHEQANTLHVSYVKTKVKLEKLKLILDEMEGKDATDAKKSHPAGGSHKKSRGPQVSGSCQTDDEDG